MAKAYVLVNVDAGSDEKVFREIQKLNGIQESHIVLGGADIIVEIASGDMESIRTVVYGQIRKIPEVRSTQTMTVVQ